MFYKNLICLCLLLSLFSCPIVNASISDSPLPTQAKEDTVNHTEHESNQASPEPDTMIDSNQQTHIGEEETACTTTQSEPENSSTLTSLATSAHENETATTQSKKSWSMSEAARKGFCNVCKKVYTDYLEGDSLDPTKLAIVASAGVVEYFVGVVWDNRNELLEYYLCFGG